MKNIYAKKVIEHFKNPKNQGKLKDYDSHGEQGSPICGDTLEIYIKVKDNKITRIGWETTGCIAAISTGSMFSELVKGKTLEEAEKITGEDVIRSLGKLPPVKVHCSLLAVGALEKAIQEYREKYKKTKSK